MNHHSSASADSVVISVLAPDEIGVFSETAGAITDQGGNIDSISQTVSGGFFTALMTASYKQERGASEIRDGILGRLPARSDVVVIPLAEETSRPRQPQDERYILTLIGRDRPGLLKLVTGYLESNRIHITDWYIEFHTGNVTHIGEIEVPAKRDIVELQAGLKSALAGTDIGSSIQHDNIFKATNDVGSVTVLLGGQRRA